MIELQVEAFFEFVGKGLTRRIAAVHTRVADRAQGRVRGAELSSMAFEAIFMAGKAGPRGIVIPMMTA